MRYSLRTVGDQSSLTCFIDGKMYTAENTHPNWEQLKAGVEAEDESITRLFDPQVAIQEAFNKVSDRVSVRAGKVYLDNEKVNTGLTNQIVRFMTAGEDFMPLVNFFEKIEANPQEHSRNQLWDWLSKRDFTITPDGDFLAYKGVHSRYSTSDKPGLTEDYRYESSSRGDAISDGIEFKSARIPQKIGSIVEMPRSDVAHDPNVACHSGLHAGNYRYASNFTGGPVLLVKINPRDVVSVPHDSNSEKIRCCRYEVVKEVKAEYTGVLWGAKAQDVSENNPYDSCGEVDCTCL